MIVRASEWTTEQVASATGGVLEGSIDLRLGGVATDTRDRLGGALFVALRGERFDAHDFLEQALDGGAAALLVQAGLLEAGRKAALARRAALIEVEDTLRALGALARHHRARMPAAIVGLTGSNGKTTTKELLAAIFSGSHRVLKTEGNLNNLIGTPLTLLGMSPAHQVGVIEMGMNQPGEIARMVEMADPDVALITNVGPAHIGNLGSMEAIAAAKGELFRGLSRTRRTVGVVNLDDPLIVREAERAQLQTVRTFGRSASAEVRLLSARPEEEGQTLELEVEGAPLSVFLPLPGAHNALNAAAAIAAATAPLPSLTGVAVSLAEVQAGLPRVKGVKGRLKSEPLGPYLLIDDCYNANAASMLAALETVGAMAARAGTRAVALLGEMRELGSFAPEEHRRVGAAAKRHGFQVLAAFGPDAAPIAEEAARGGLLVHHQSEDEQTLYQWFKARLMPGDRILVKGSRGIHMERFIERLRREIG